MSACGRSGAQAAVAEHGHRQYRIVVTGRLHRGIAGDGKCDIHRLAHGSLLFADGNALRTDVESLDARIRAIAPERENFLSGRTSDRQNAGVASSQMLRDKSEDVGIAVFLGIAERLEQSARVPQAQQCGTAFIPASSDVTQRLKGPESRQPASRTLHEIHHSNLWNWWRFA